MPLTRILAGAITDANVTTPKLADAGVTTVKLADVNVTTSKIANAGVTSPKLAQNLSISLTRVLEEASISTTAHSTVYFFNANTTANLTFNLRANATHTFDSATTIGETTSIAIAVKHGGERHAANLCIDGGLITGAFSGTDNAIFYAGNTRPNFQTVLTNGELNLFSYSVFKTAANAYTVVASNTLFGLG